MKLKFKQFFKTRKVYHYVRYFIGLIFTILCVLFPFLLVILLVVVLITMLVSIFKGMQFLKLCSGNGVIYGGRGKGKGILLNFKIRKDKTKPYCNVPYANAVMLDNPSEYLNSITPLGIDDFINDTIVPVKKLDKFEKRNVYLDDINVYLPNWADSLLKKKYDSMPPFLAINRHLYDAYCVITTQDRERPYKVLKELQGDFSIKAVRTLGWGFIWQCIPFLNNFVYTKYIYHELSKSADMLPFKAVGAVNEIAKHGYLTSGQATKEVYEATNGKICYGFVLQLKKHISYDTRYFHEKVYGYKP